MGKPKKRLLKSVSFGKQGHMARAVVEKFIEEGGDVSKQTRDLWVWWGYSNEKYLEYRIILLKGELKQVGQDIADKVKKRQDLRQDLKELDIDWTELE